MKNRTFFDLLGEVPKEEEHLDMVMDAEAAGLWEEADLREARALHQRTLREAKSLHEENTEDMGRPSDDMSYEAMLERARDRRDMRGV